MMKRFVMVLAFFAALALALPAMAADVKIKGDFNNRFMAYTNHSDWLVGDHTDGMKALDGDVNESWGEAKYRMWVDASTNDGKVKGVWAIEVGALHYGDESKGAGGYSGDGIVIENRWMYTDFQLPWCQNNARIRMGLQPFTVNPYLWQETVMGVVFNGGMNNVDYQLAWLRPYDQKRTDDDDDADDLDAFVGRVNFKPMDGVKSGLFVLYMHGDDDDSSVSIDDRYQNAYEVKNFANSGDLSLLTIGTDGSFGKDNFFGKWDLMYQNGSLDKFDGMDYDIEAWFAHVDLGVKMDKMKFTYTFWYASGQDPDDMDDDDIDAFISVDLDRMDNICLFEGGFTDDDYFTEAPYLEMAGFIMNKLALDYKADKKLS
ncbi:MAG: hypothetical protein J7J70_09400, partial [Deltaproteobacteria bacterium]|nr:hypothetical protein [Candidatus Tharpellaceae bacterium]